MVISVLLLDWYSFVGFGSDILNMCVILVVVIDSMMVCVMGCLRSFVGCVVVNDGLNSVLVIIFDYLC